MTSSTNQHRLQRIRDLLAGQQRRLPVTTTQHPVPAPEVVESVVVATAKAAIAACSSSNSTDEEKLAAAAAGDGNTTSRQQQQIKRPLRTMTSDEAKARANQCFKEDYDEDHHHPTQYEDEDDTRPGDSIGGTTHYHEQSFSSSFPWHDHYDEHDEEARTPCLRQYPQSARARGGQQVHEEEWELW
jgi:hypothetical protein